MNTMKKTNPVLKDTIRTCEEAARKHDAAVWSDVAAALQTSNRSQAEVNLSDIDQHTEDGDTVVVPGKVLGAGRLTHDVTVAAFQFTNSARKAIEDAGDSMFIDELVDDHPEGADVQVIT